MKLTSVRARSVVEDMDNNVGRGEQATSDMKNRIAALRGDGSDLIAALWARNRRAFDGGGFDYEYADETPEPDQPAGIAAPPSP